MRDFEAPTPETRLDTAEQPLQPPPPPRSPYEASPFTGYYDTHTPEVKPTRPRHLRKKHPRLSILLLAAACLVSGLGLGRAGAARDRAAMAGLEARVNALQAQLEQTRQQTPDLSTPLPTGGVMTPAQVYARTVDSVVKITCKRAENVGGQVVQGTFSGSGFILSADGYIATNYHVVADMSDITVTTRDGNTRNAVFVGRDNSADMAVIKIEAEDLQPVTLGSSKSLAIGDMVVAIGNPLTALEATQTVGYIGGKNREITTDNNVVTMLQTDAAINSGNSGGPLLNMRGEVVGITTAKYSGSSSAGVSIEGMSFAIPIDDLKDSLRDLQTLGYVSSAYLGITGMNVDASVAEIYGLPNGVLVDSVEPDGAAAKAGLRPKDIITDLGGQEIQDFTALSRMLRGYKPGDTTTITVSRGRQSLTLSITMGERPHTAAAPNTAPEE